MAITVTPSTHIPTTYSTYNKDWHLYIHSCSSFKVIRKVKFFLKTEKNKLFTIKFLFKKQEISRVNYCKFIYNWNEKISGFFWSGVRKISPGKLPPRKLPTRKLLPCENTSHDYSAIWKLPHCENYPEKFAPLKLVPMKLPPHPWENYPPLNSLHHLQTKQMK